MDKKLRKAIKMSSHSKVAMKLVEHAIFQNPLYKAMVGTTQAVDLIGGGVKTNALPENAWAVVNHRISPTRYFIYPELSSK
jgi:Gly-Xaa carboxypeptidase